MSKSDYPDYPPQRIRKHRLVVGDATFIVSSNVDDNKRWIREVHHVRRHRKGGRAEVSIYPNGGRKPSAALASLWAHLGIDPDARWKECAADHPAFPAKRSIRTAMDAADDARKNAAAAAALVAAGWTWVDDGAGHWDAPPAQSVDLDAMRALLQRRIEQWRSHLPADPGAPGTREIETKGEHDYNNDVRIYREGIAVMEEALSKIDSQAVGEPVAEVVDVGGVRKLRVYPDEGLRSLLQFPVGTKFYTAPPAQAVDLERFRGTVKSQHSMTEWMHRCGFVSAEKLEESKKNHDHLMALIDSQAVGNK